MSEFLKPQSPLKHKDGAYIYPLTTADQVILENGNRLNAALNNMSSKPKAGFIYPLANSVVPDGFLLCDGAEYSRVQYEELFAAIGTIYGEGDGSTTFNVPNLQTRVPVGAGEGYGLGATGGEATHTLTVDEMPSHSHSGKDDAAGLFAGWGNKSGDGWVTASSNTANGGNWDTANTGGSQPHNNMQPYTVVNYIIATGKDTGVSVSDIVMGAQALPLEVQYGGTGATTLKDVRHNLGINARNLLDNSDFANPVNQRGKTSYSRQGYGIDRWRNWNGENVTTVNSGSVSCTEQLWQDIEPHKIKPNTPYTFAACQIDGSILCLCGLAGEETKLSDGTKNKLIIAFQDDSPAVWLAGGDYVWAALYEGEYTAETLPEYQPKGYGAELAECQRYFNQIPEWAQTGVGAINYNGTSANIVVPIGVVMRTNPTVSNGKQNSYLRVNGQSISCADATITARIVGAYLIMNIVVNGLTNYANHLAEFDVGDTPMSFSADL